MVSEVCFRLQMSLCIRMDQRDYEERLVLVLDDKGYYSYMENLRRKGMNIVFITPGVPDIDLCADLTGCDSTNCSLSVTLTTVFNQKTNWRCVLTMLFTNKKLLYLFLHMLLYL